MVPAVQEPAAAGAGAAEFSASIGSNGPRRTRLATAAYCPSHASILVIFPLPRYSPDPSFFLLALLFHPPAPLPTPHPLAMSRTRNVRLVAAAAVAAVSAVAAAWTPVTGSPAARHPAISWAAAVAPPPTTAAAPAAAAADPTSATLRGGPPVAARQSYEGDLEPWRISPTQWLAKKSEDLLNDRRAEAGRSRLIGRWDLRADAIRQAEAMANRGTIFHQAMVPLLSKWNAVWVSENVAMNYMDEGAWGLVRLWMNSPGHRLNLLDDRATHTGCGVVQRGGWNWSSCVYAQTY